MGTLVAVVTPARLLRLLNLLSARPWWAGPELAERLEVTERTLRRDVTRLRGLGYPIEGTTGPYGGYRLGAAGHLPPLLLDDDEAVAVAVALRSASGGGASGLESAALSALTKLDQVLPVRLRERIGALRSVTVALGPHQVPPVDLDVLRARGRGLPPARSGCGSRTRPATEPHPSATSSPTGSSTPTGAGTWWPSTGTATPGAPSASTA